MSINTHLSPEKRLLIEILKRAVNDYVGHFNTCQADSQFIQASAKRWIHRPIEIYKPEWSFAWICEHLDLEPDEVKKNIKNLDHLLSLDKSSRSKRLNSVSEYEMSFYYRYYGESTEDLFDVRLWA